MESLDKIPERIAWLPRRELISLTAGEARTLSTDCETMLVEILGVRSPSLISPITHSHISPGWRCANESTEFLPFVGPYAFIDRPGTYEFIITAAFSPALASEAVFDLVVTRGLSRDQFVAMSQGHGSHDVRYFERSIGALTEVTIADTVHALYPSFRTLLIQNKGDTTLSVRIARENPAQVAEYFVGVAAAANFRTFDSSLLGRSTITLFANDTIGNTDVMIGVSLW